MKKLWSLVVGLGVGAVVSVCAGFVQADRINFQGHKVYYGVPLAVAIVVGFLLLLNRHFQSRWPGVGVLLTWVAVTWRFTQESSSGDVGFIPSANANAYLIAGSLCVGIACASPLLKSLRSESFDQTYPQPINGNNSE